MNKHQMKILFHSYKKMDLLKAFLSGLIFIVIYTGIFITPSVMISMLYVPFMLYFLLGMFMIGSLIFYRSLGIMIEYLRAIETIKDINYNTLHRQITFGFSIILYGVLAYVYLQYFH